MAVKLEARLSNTCLLVFATSNGVVKNAANAPEQNPLMKDAFNSEFGKKSFAVLAFRAS